MNNPDRLCLQLGLVLHHFADRVIRNSNIEHEYRKHKAKLLALSEHEYSQGLQEIKSFFDKFLKNNSGLFEGSIENMSEQAYVKLFNHTFNPTIDSPIKVNSKHANSKDYRDFILQAMNNDRDLQLNFLQKQNSLSINLPEDMNDAAQTLAASLLSNRRNKDFVKYAKSIGEINGSAVTSIKLVNTYVNESYNIYANSGKVQSLVTNMKSYDSILEFLMKMEGNKRAQTVKYMFDIIKHGTSIEAVSLSKAESYRATDLAVLLFITELERNKATLFTAPMFLDRLKDNGLEELLKDNKGRVESLFPMADKGAVQASRDILHLYKMQLIVPYIFYNWLHKFIFFNVLKIDII